MPTIGAFAQLLPAGFVTRPYRCTDSTVLVCLEGKGVANVGKETWEFQQNDVFVVPSWQQLQIHSSRQTIMFGFSDRPVQQALGLWREQPSPPPAL
jgi:gentisate 1,2-dioxygenase